MKNEMENTEQNENNQDQLDKIKDLIYKKYGLGALTVFARMHKINYQELSNVLNGRCRNEKVLKAFEKEFKIKL